jgi:hypothetical protein
MLKQEGEWREGKSMRRVWEEEGKVMKKKREWSDFDVNE